MNAYRRIYDFGLDMYLLPDLDLSFQFPEELVEETEEHVTRRDSNGVLVKRIKQGEGHPRQWLDYKLKNAGDWFECKERLKSTAGRIDPGIWADSAAARASCWIKPGLLSTVNRGSRPIRASQAP